MRTTHKQRVSSAMRIAGLFALVVALLIGLSLCVKAILLISRSHFDSHHQFILQIVDSPTQSDIVIFSPDTDTIAVLAIKGKGAGNAAMRSVELPTDAVVQEVAASDTGKKMIDHVLLSNWHDGINILDRIKLLWYTQTVADENITTTSFSLPLSASQDSQITQLATDQSVYKENMTIAVVNGSGILGLGNTIAKVLTHSGFNVISVTTAEKDQDVSTVKYSGEKTYTVIRLGRILGLRPKGTQPGIADITLILGKDGKNL